MRRAWQALVVLALVAAGAVLAHLHVASQTYYPVVRVATPEGLTYSVVQNGIGDRRACGAANDRFLAPLKLGCKECRVVYARCERALEGIEEALHDGKVLGLHVVVAQGLRMMIEGPTPGARKACDFLAADLVKHGLPTAACLYPRGSEPAAGG